MENWEVNDERIALASNYILSYYLVGTGVRNLTKVDVRWKDIGLNLVFRDLTCVQLQYEVFLECFHSVVFLKVCENGLVTDGDLTVDKVIADLILACLLLQRDVLLVELV